MLYLRIAQYSGFISAQITNATLLVLIFSRADKLFGSYKHVMSTFALYAMIYSWIEIITQPIVHVKVPLFIVIMDSPIRYETWFGNDFTSVYCGSFALCISLLAAQFVYRYIAVCKPRKLVMLEGVRVIFLFVPCIICFIAWTAFVYFGMKNTVEKQEYLKDELMFYYGEDSSKVSFIAPMYWSIDKNGEKHWNIGELFSSLGCDLIIVVCLSTIMFCAVKTYQTMKSARSSMSHRTRELNRQLFITLSLQTLLPLFMMYLPVGLLINLPIFGIEAGRFTNVAGASVALYPSLEPLIATFFISDFRHTIMCRKKKRVSTITRGQQSTYDGNSDKSTQNAHSPIFH